MKQLAMHIKKTPVLLALVAVLLAPMVVRAYAQEDTTTEPPAVEQTVTEEPTEQPQEPVEPEAPVEEPVEQPEEPPVEEEVPENPDTTVDPDGVTLGEAQIIAQTEHSGSTIKQVKTKVLDGNAVYVFVFEDGWKVYVRATDGLVVKSEDKSNKEHGCKNKLKDDAQFQAWLQERKERRKQHSSETNGQEREKKRSKHNSNRGEGWGRR